MVRRIRQSPFCKKKKKKNCKNVRCRRNLSRIFFIQIIIVIEKNVRINRIIFKRLSSDYQVGFELLTNADTSMMWCYSSLSLVITEIMTRRSKSYLWWSRDSHPFRHFHVCRFIPWHQGFSCKKFQMIPRISRSFGHISLLYVADSRARWASCYQPVTLAWRLWI